LVMPGEAYAFQFVAKQAGTYWYHPQIIHFQERSQGMYGAIVVAARNQAKTFDKDVVLVLAEVKAEKAAADLRSPLPAVTYFRVNGKAAPAMPAIEVSNGEKVRLRLINASQHTIPLSLSGHRLEVVAVNGSDPLEPHVFRDTVTLNPGDRVDVDVACDN